MSERGCIKCGYILAGLPAAGTVVTCPECGHANDLAVPLPRPMRWFTPWLWGLVPAALGFLVACLYSTGDSGRAILGLGFILVGMVCVGFSAGLRKYALIGLEPAMGRAPRPLWARLALSVCAGAVSVVVYLVIIRAVAFVTYWISAS